MKGCTGKLKQRIKNGDILFFGCVMDCRSGTVIEMYHETGYDAVLIDREHTAFNHETILEQVRLARVLEFPCMVRVAEISYAEMNRVMDQAPDGIFVPRIRSRKDVEEVMRLTTFPPSGVKGFGASTCPAGKYLGWLPDSTQQLEHFNNHFVRGIQIETKEAFENLDDILSVPGIDLAVVGNDDLSLGLGISGQFDSSEYIKSVQQIIAACERHGVVPGIAGGEPEKVRFWKDRGMRVFWAASDIVCMWLAAKQVITDIHRTLNERKRTS